MAMKHTALAALTIIIALIFAACGSSGEAALTAEEFTSRLEGAGHIVEDFTHEFGSIPYLRLETALAASMDDLVVGVLIFETAVSAKEIYDAFRQVLIDERESASFYQETNLPNSDRLTKTADGHHEVLIRAGNTIITIETTTENKDDAQAVLDLLGY